MLPVCKAQPLNVGEQITGKAVSVGIVLAVKKAAVLLD